MTNSNFESPLQQPQFYSVSEETAAQIALQASQWLEQTLGVSTIEFFREVKSETFTGKQIPVYAVREINAEMVPTNSHFWVYASPVTQILQASDRPFTYFDNYEAAISQHIQNLINHTDSYVRGAGGASTNSKEITRSLFEIYLAYGLMVTTHEPFHPWVSHLLTSHNLEDAYNVNEPITSYLGLAALLQFAHSINLDPKVVEGVEKYVKRTLQSLKFYRLAYYLMQRIYVNLPEGSVTRSADAEAMLNEIREYAMRTEANPDIDTLRVNQLNNAMLTAGMSYVNTLLVQDYFAQNDVDPVQFITDPSVQDQHLSGLVDFIKAQASEAPADLDQEWDEMKRQIDAGEYSSYVLA
jgi:hypothetical protein